MNYPKRIELCEVGPRDGLQKAKKVLSAKEKATLIDMASDAGYKEIEFGAFTEFKEVNSMSNSGEVYQLLNKHNDVIYRALVSSANAIETAASFGVSAVKISEFASEYIHGPIPAKVKLIREACEKAGELNLTTFGSISLPFAGPQDGIVPYENVYRLVNEYVSHGVNRISLGDAAGMATPKLLQERLWQLKKDFPSVTWVLHLHDTWGLGFANVIAGMEIGIRHFDCSFAGVGGCPFIKNGKGNIASEQIVYMLKQMNIETNIDLEKAYILAKHVKDLDVGDTNSPYMNNILSFEDQEE